MPSSVVSVGHDGRGVNLQNLRSANASGKLKTSGGMRPPHDWHREAEEFSSQATLARNASGALRDHSSTIQSAFETRARNGQMNTQEALKSKLSKSEHLSSLLSETLQGTDGELAALTAMRATLDKSLNRKGRALDLNLKRLKLRAQRPKSELVADDVQSQLLGQGKMLQATMDKIQRCMKSTDRDLERLEMTRAMLAADKEDKDHAISLDAHALNLTAGDPIHLHEAGSLQKKVFAYPHNWYKGTGQGVQDARHLQNDSAKLRFAIERMLQESSEAEKIMDEQLTAALKERAQVTGSVRTHMQAQVDACRAELMAAQQRKAELQAAIDGKREPIALARQRYHMRKQRPVRELVHDEVEDALTQEFHDLQVIVNNLQMKMKQQNAEISQLHATLAHLEGNINDKANAGALDQQCLDIRPPGSVAGSTVITRGSSMHLALQQKIESMEGALVEARKSRQAMEKQLESLRGSVAGSTS